MNPFRRLFNRREKAPQLYRNPPRREPGWYAHNGGWPIGHAPYDLTAGEIVDLFTRDPAGRVPANHPGGNMTTTMGTETVPSNEDILRFCVALLTARTDDDLVGQLVNQQLAELPPFLRESFLKVALRTVVTEFFGPMARMVDEIVPGWTETGLGLQAAENEGVNLNDDGQEGV